jgi:hypothetical protein
MFRCLLFTVSVLLTSVYQEKRMLIIYADKASNPLLKKQMDILKTDPRGIEERDIQIKTYYLELDRARFEQQNIKGGFTIILVGKDGGNKLRQTSPLTLKQLYSTIDAMPMRRQEMKRRP